MSIPLDSDPSNERFDGYEAELKLVQADLNQKLDQIPELLGEPRKAAVTQAERALEEAQELLGSMKMEKATMPSNVRTKYNAKLRNYESDIDSNKRKLKSLSDDRSALFGDRYRDEPGADEQLEQRQQLLSGTDRLGRTSDRLRESQRVANETEGIGANILGDLARQRETITHTRGTLLESETYADRSIKTLRGMARRMATNRIITIAIITILVILIIAVIYSKLR